MDDSSKFDHLAELLSAVSDDLPWGEDLENIDDEEFIRIERDAEKAQEVREWKTLKKDILNHLEATKDFRLVAHLSKALLHTEEIPVDGITQSLYLTHEYIDKYWDCSFPSEDTDEDEPDEKFADRINAIAELGSWKSVVLPLRKKCPVLDFEGFGEFFLEDLVSFKNGDAVEEKQSPKVFLEELPQTEKDHIDTSLASFQLALDLVEKTKKLLLEKTGIGFIDFDSYLIPNLQDGVAVLSDLSPNAKEEPSPDILNNKGEQTTDISSIKNRDDVVRLLDMICAYYAEKEPSSPLPLLLQRARSIVHKDFLEVLEELVPDSMSMTEPVFGRSEESEN